MDRIGKNIGSLEDEYDINVYFYALLKNARTTDQKKKKKQSIHLENTANILYSLLKLGFPEINNTVRVGFTWLVKLMF